MGSSGEVENMKKNGKPLAESEKEVNLDKWMKPFKLGWRREVVLRLITGSNYCDIYYFHPSGKKLRSLTEVKANLTDDLTPDCFCFKKIPLNVSSETIRNAMDRSGVTKKKISTSWEEARDRNQLRLKGKESEKTVPLSRLTRRQLMKRKKEQQSKILEANKLRKTRRVPGKKIMKKTGDKGLDGLASDLFIVRKMLLKARPKILRNTMVVCRRRKTSKKVKSADGMNKGPARRRRLDKPEIPKKFLKRGTRRQLKEQERSALDVRKVTDQKRVPRRGKPAEKVQEEPTETSEKEAGTENNSAQTNEVQSEAEEPDSASKATTETGKKGDCNDIRSIVQRNIGKYREMRKKQMKEGLSERARKKISCQSVPRQHYEPVSKKLHMYLKPLERGWRRELVHRVNGPDAAGRSDVYYFHPNGKRLRSAREIANHLTQGLTLEYFTFRKEALGCGEPFETIRNARLNKSQETKSKKKLS
ncbi:UNVERIFIED_CONTAM: hypothetical protein PYX00_002761 [Menopon gallinae]|uniref:MBD domain-containing protein n=1 Tax=Menopon gallinae TaxID=328185 RepID=A0AAW2HYL9_9NEOP